MVETNSEVSFHGIFHSVWKKKKKDTKRQSDKVKLSLRNAAFVISCMCTNRGCGVGGMRRRKREKRRVGREEGILR